MRIELSSVLCAIAASACATQPPAHHPIDPPVERQVDVGPEPMPALSDSAAKRASLVGNGRNVMRAADGSLVATFIRKSTLGNELLFTASTDDGNTWNTFASQRDREPTSPALDSNYQGAYLAFISEKDQSGHLLHVRNPQGEDLQAVHHGPLPPEVLAIRFSFVAASRDGWGASSTRAQSVAYGWVDAETGRFYVGVSRDGQDFPPAQVIHTDASAVSGPSVSIQDDYVFMLYQTKNPEFMPNGLADVPNPNVGGIHHVWMESRDGGTSWTAPTPLFATVDDFPKLHAVRTESKGLEHHGMVASAGGSLGAQDVSQTLGGERPRLARGRTPPDRGGVFHRHGQDVCPLRDLRCRGPASARPAPGA